MKKHNPYPGPFDMPSYGLNKPITKEKRKAACKKHAGVPMPELRRRFREQERTNSNITKSITKP